MLSTLRNRPIISQLLIVAAVIIAIIVLTPYLLSLNKKPASRQIMFRVEASGGFANITMQAGDISITKAKTLNTPWQQTHTVAHNTKVFLTAANPTQSGTITCILTLDGQPWKKETTTAPKNGVACAGIVP